MYEIIARHRLEGRVQRSAALEEFRAWLLTTRHAQIAHLLNPDIMVGYGDGEEEQEEELALKTKESRDRKKERAAAIKISVLKLTNSKHN